MNDRQTKIVRRTAKTSGRIESELRRQIEAGHWGAGAMIPSRRDLAREYGVSPVTVARAVQTLIEEGALLAEDRRGTFVTRNGHPISTSLEPHARQLDQIEAQTSPQSTTVRNGSIGIVAAVYEHVSQDPQVLHAIEQAFSETGLATTTFNRAMGAYDAPLISLPESIQSLRNSGVAGIVIICFDLDPPLVEQALAECDLGNTPLVCIVSGPLYLPIPHVFYDNRIGGFQAGNHLLEKGHRRITMVCPATASWVTERVAGIQHAVAHAKLPPESLQLMTGAGKIWNYLDDSVGMAYNMAQIALASGWTPSGGVIGMNDQTCFGILNALADNGYKAGRDYALMGFDDHREARVRGLSTVRPPLEDMGRAASKLLIEATQGGQTSQQLRLRAHIIPRATTNFSATR